MHAHVPQHVSFEGLGSIAAWLTPRDAVVTYTRFFESATPPGPSAVDLVIALGAALAIISHCRDELVDGTYIQIEAAMRGVPFSTSVAINGLKAEVLSYLTDTERP